MLTPGYKRWVKSVSQMKPRTKEEKILKKYIKNVLNLAYTYEGKAEIDDLVSVGITALLEAVECHDPDKGDLGAFINSLIKTRLYNFAVVECNTVKAPKYTIATASNIRQLRHSFEQYQPDALHLCKELIVNGTESLEGYDLITILKEEAEATLTKIKQRADTNKIKYLTLVSDSFLYLDITTKEFNDDVGFMEDERFDSYIEDLEKLYDLKEISKLVQSLPSRQKEVIIALLESDNNEEIATKLGVTRQNVFGLKKSAVEFLKKHLEER